MKKLFVLMCVMMFSAQGLRAQIGFYDSNGNFTGITKQGVETLKKLEEQKKDPSNYNPTIVGGQNNDGIEYFYGVDGKVIGSMPKNLGTNANPNNYSNESSSGTSGRSTSDCVWCKGSGKVTINQEVGTYGNTPYWVTCHECGTRHLSSTAHSHTLCRHCGGSGKMR